MHRAQRDVSTARNARTARIVCAQGGGKPGAVGGRRGEGDWKHLPLGPTLLMYPRANTACVSWVNTTYVSLGQHDLFALGSTLLTCPSVNNTYVPLGQDYLCALGPTLNICPWGQHYLCALGPALSLLMCPWANTTCVPLGQHHLCVLGPTLLVCPSVKLIRPANTTYVPALTRGCAASWPQRCCCEARLCR